jgi:hypothetical protein
MPGSTPTPDLPDRPDPPQDRSPQDGSHEDRPAAGTDQRLANQPNTNQPSTNQPGCTARLLGIVRRLIDYGRRLTGTLQQNPTTYEPHAYQHKFGTADITLVLRRIARGIMLALALEARLLTRVDRPQPSPAPTGRPAPDAGPPLRPKRAPRPKPVDWRAAADAALLDRLPTAEEIAARMQHRPIGALILDIFRDLGILPADPQWMWREMTQDILVSGGNVAGLFKAIGDRHYKWFVEEYGDVCLTFAAMPLPLAGMPSTGPP